MWFPQTHSPNRHLAGGRLLVDNLISTPIEGTYGHAHRESIRVTDENLWVPHPSFCRRMRTFLLGATLPTWRAAFTNENTNLLLRQYFRRGTDLSAYSQAQLDQVALRLNQRPRETLGFETPASRLRARVASTV